jgi:hypothetical protein
MIWVRQYLMGDAKQRRNYIKHIEMLSKLLLNYKRCLTSIISNGIIILSYQYSKKLKAEGSRVVYTVCPKSR